MQLPCSLFKTWVLTLCMAKEGDGRLPDVGVLAFKLRLRVDVANQHLDSLIKAGLIDRKDDYLTPHNWDKYQYVSDVSTARVKQHRNAKRNAERNVDETFQERPQRTETEKEKETNKETAASSTADAVSGVSVAKAQLTKQQAEWFETWWANVWRKDAKEPARKSFLRLIRDAETFAAVSRGLAAQLPAMLAKESQYRPMMATWLNQRRWEDDPAAYQPTQPTLSQYRESEVW